MRVFLASEHFGNYSENFIELVGKGAKVGFVMNAADKRDQSNRQAYSLSVQKELESFGFEAVEIDLREHGKKSLEDRMSGLSAVLVAGGNAFVLRGAMKESGFDELITDLLKDDEIVYAGWSAGAIVAAPTLKGLDLMDEPDIADNVIWEGLGLVEYSIIPHWKSIDYPKYAKIGLDCEDYFKSRSLPYKTLEDTQAIVFSGSEEVFLS